MSYTSYAQKVAAIVECSTKYEHCAVAVEQLEKQTKSVVSLIVDGKLPAKLARAVIPHNSRMSQFIIIIMVSRKTTRKDFRYVQ